MSVGEGEGWWLKLATERLHAISVQKLFFHFIQVKMYYLICPSLVLANCAVLHGATYSADT